MNLLIETNVISELIRGRNAEAAVTAWFESVSAEQIFTSVVVLGEIRRGIALLSRRDKPQAQLLERRYAIMRQRLGARVLAVDEAVTDMWARISVPDPLPAFDGLIAATALVHEMTVVTRNSSDFDRVGVPVVDPWSRKQRR